MNRLEAAEEYAKAPKPGQKEAREYQSRGLSPNPEVLHEIAGDLAADQRVLIGLAEIPGNRSEGHRKAVGCV